MNLSKDIIELLKENDCVIIPAFGGFVANYFSGGVDFKTQEFFPPARRIAFNQNLKNNDGLLINYLSIKHNCDWQAAGLMVKTFVDEIKMSLSNDNYFVFEGLGKIVKEKNSLVFYPEANLNFLDDSFGLEKFVFPVLKFNEIRPEVTRTISKVKEAKANRPKRKTASWVYTLSAAAVLGGLIFLTIKTGVVDKIFNNDKEYAIVVPIENLNNNKPKVNASSENKDSKSEEIANSEPLKTENPEPAIRENTENTEISTFDSQEVQNNVHIIAGCFSVKENAENLCSKLQSQGYPAVILPGNNFYRVSVKSYSDKNSAAKELENLKSETGNTSLWILAL
ncbi:MAG: SPOR domain-containing protein [Bacteroidales bacterium]|jgi:cell division septation protein DedD/nucleoid DNA-binding protein|nr:SPOR domain-containing protein [Bacteroidales bacterium]HOL97718.1 SPOR domain-containing protein [Bacteroidales bacterium]HOM36329.1 SPOR domain-containing protein [Bacteroidales bacterium]HPD23613.1 SPOR domain-containing protein [Bacteroidales bacterium]HRS99474.1 SPOR domain-containing protein [Bacteroidales bacterium]